MVYLSKDYYCQFTIYHWKSFVGKVLTMKIESYKYEAGLTGYQKEILATEKRISFLTKKVSVIQIQMSGTNNV